MAESEKEIVLTDEQVAKIPKYVTKWSKRCLLETFDKDKAASIAKDIYLAEKKSIPPIRCIDSPTEVPKILQEFGSKDEYDAPDDGLGWAEVRCFYDFVSSEASIELPKVLQLLIQLDFTGAFAWWFYEEVCILLAPPKFHFEPRVRGGLAARIETAADEERGAERRLHCLDGPAVAWGSDGIYFYKGREVPKWYIMEKENITVDAIWKEKNIENRRIMQEIYGLERFIKDSGGKKIQQDDYGELWSLEKGDTIIRGVSVANATPEPDGSYKRYFIPVPPEIESCRAGCAWSFGKEEDEYAPAIET